MKNLAQINLYEGENGYKGFGPLGLEDGQSGVTVFAKFLSSAIGLITVIGIIWFVFILTTGAIAMITSGGDKASLESAKKKVVSGLIGLIVLVLGLFIINLIGSIIGIPNILNFANLFTLVTGGAINGNGGPSGR